MSKAIIQMTQLGRMGRFGNQLFQYAFLKTYARRYGLEVQAPKWVGCYLYGCNDPEPIQALPIKREEWSNPTDPTSWKLPPRGNEYVNCDWSGYGQVHTSYFQADRAFIQDLFRPLAAHRRRMDAAVERLQEIGSTWIGLHIRRGDYGRGIFHSTPVEWYLKWLDQHWGDYTDQALFLAAEDRSLKDAFSKYNPMLVEDLGITLGTEPYPHYPYFDLDLERRDPVQIDFFPDFHILSMCAVIVGSNSTYSFCAAMLNPALQRYYRSSLPAQGFVELDPWDTEPLALERAEDFAKTIPEVSLKENPYW